MNLQPSDPYQPPPNLAPQDAQVHYDVPAGTPKVWIWYKVYCGFMTLLYLMCFIVGIFLLLSANEIASVEPTDPPLVIKIQGIVLGAIGVTFTTLFGTGLFLRPSKVAWYVGFATIGIGMTSACCLPATIPLLIFWLKQETRLFMRAMPGQS
ncbi:MAG: hypothetical protein Aurels2KO_05270 [Aureliella sp.]